MHFGKKLLASRYEPWAAYYLDYAHLKTQLEEDEQASHPAESAALVATVTQSTESHHRHPSSGAGSLHQSLQENESSEFLRLLNREVEKILLFFLSEQGQVANEMAELQREIRLRQQDPVLWSESDAGQTPPLSKSMTDLGTHLLRLIKYVDMNLTALRKILKKHDKLRKIKLTAKYLGRKGPLLQPLLTNESLDGLIRVYHATLGMWNELQQEQRMMTGQFADAQLSSPAHTNKTTQIGGSSSMSGNGSPRKSLSSSSGHGFYSMTGLDEKGPDLILQDVKEARKKLQKTNEFVQFLAAPMMVQESDEEGESVTDEGEGRELPSEFSNYLNLLSTFFYMSNYYIVAPSSDTYAIKLGSDPSIAGMIIGYVYLAFVEF